MTDGTVTPPAWHNGVDAGVLAAWQNKGYDLTNPLTTATKMWEQYAHLESHLGAPADRIIRLPKDAADEAGWTSTYRRLGMPAEAKDYDFSAVKFADGTDLEAGFTDAMRGALHKARVSKDAAPEVVKAVIKYLDDAAAAEGTTKAQTLTEQKDALKKSWGPRHDENLLAAKQAVRRLGLDPETVAALEGVIGYDKVMEMFRKVGVGSNEDTFHAGREPGNPATQQGAQARLEELQKDAGWVNRLMSGDVTARKEFNALTEQISGVTSAAA